MSDQMSDADKIREKRMAKIQQQAAQNAAAAAASNPNPNENVKDNDKGNAASENPFTKLQQQPPRPPPADKPSGKPSISITPSSRPSAQAKPPQADTLESWEHRTISSLFRLTLDKGKTSDAQGNPLIFVEETRAEIESNDANVLRFSVSMLDQAILEAARDHTKGKPLDYLLPCWRRVSAQWRGFRTDVKEDPKRDIVQEARRLCMSYCIFAITMPELFNIEVNRAEMFASHILLDMDHERGINLDFWGEISLRIEDDDDLKTAIVEMVQQLSAQLASKSLNDDYRAYVQALRTLSRYKPLVAAISEADNFCPEQVAAQDIEKTTLLGPFFQLSPIQAPVAVNYFSGAETKGRGFILTSQNALRLTLRTLQEELFDIVDAFIKAGPGPRNRTLDWFAKTVNLNHRRRAMRPDARVISSDGFMVNVTVILDRLSEPFIDAKFTKIGRIEPEYFRRNPRVDIKDETKINADQAAADAFYAQPAEGTSNFISEIFFLTMAAHHYGTEAAESKLTGMRREMKRLDEHIATIERDRAQYTHHPLALQRFDDGLRRLKAESEKYHATYHAIEGILADELLQARSMSFMRYVIVWLIRMVTNRNFPEQKYQIPLPEQQPDVFRCLPEYFIEDVVDHFKFVTSHMPHVISSTQCDELVMLCITFLRSSDYIKNPGVKSGLITILFYGVMPTPNKRDGLLGDVLNGLPFALEHLLHALMQAYIECESTGSHTQFYDKFNIRYEIFQVIKNIWKNDVYHDKLKQESRHNAEFFIQFVNMILNDATYVLDESFTAFNTIAKLTDELRETSLSEEVRKEKEQALEDSKGKAKSYMQLTTESIDTLSLFTNVLAESFTAPEIVQRLADMLDYNLDALVGPKQINLKVENPEQYNFRPAQLLGELLTIYQNLATKRSFQVAVARDGRSYKHANFEKAATVQRKFNRSKPEADLLELLKFADAVKAVREEEDAAEADLGDAPDEFLDPLLATLMEDPVILPVSKTVIDRSTIRQHLLSDPHDPFNRAPLKIEDVLPADDIKRQIQEWKAGKLQAREEAKMDTSEG